MIWVISHHPNHCGLCAPRMAAWKIHNMPKISASPCPARPAATGSSPVAPCGGAASSAADLRRMAAQQAAAARCVSLVRRRRLRISRLGEDRAARGKERRPPRDFSSTKFFVQVRGAYSILPWPNHNKQGSKP